MGVDDGEPEIHDGSGLKGPDDVIPIDFRALELIQQSSGFSGRHGRTVAEFGRKGRHGSGIMGRNGITRCAGHDG
jgi:hypothetical protein